MSLLTNLKVEMLLIKLLVYIIIDDICFDYYLLESNLSF